MPQPFLALDRIDEAQAAADQMQAIADEQRLRSAQATAALVRAGLAVAAGASATARAAFEEAMALGEEASGVLEHAQVQAAYGRFLRRAGHRRQAGSQLERACETFAALGAEPFLERCNAELAACGLASTRHAKPDWGLTPQELAVTRLVCAGHSNRDVAADLVLSVKTVGYNLGNAYTKLGVRSRTQLAALLGDAARRT